MSAVTTWIRRVGTDPTRRRLALTAASGAAIVAAFVLDWGFALATWRAGLLVVAAVMAGSDIAVRAWGALRRRQVTIDLLVTVAAAGAVAIGEYWEAAAVTFLFVFGAYLESRALGRTRAAVRELLDLAPAMATVVRDGRQVEVPAAEVVAGETVMIKPGTTVPVDGQVTDGAAAVDESAVTGEPIPAEKTVGTVVHAGTISQNGLLQVTATGVGADTTLARIIRRVEEAQEATAPAQRFIERFARWYTPGVIALAAVAFALTGDVRLALTLMVIGCPGALVISTPVAIVTGIGRAARRGILIKGGESLETAGRIDILAVDKTGTLTEGRPQLTDVIALQPLRVPAMVGGSDDSPSNATAFTDAQRQVLHYAAVVESGSEHPLGRPILAAAEGLCDLPTPTAFGSCTGRGVRATAEGKVVGVGGPELMAALDVPVNPDAQGHLDRLRAEGKTAVLVR